MALGQTSIFTVIFWIIIFFIVGLVALFPILSAGSSIVIAIGNLSGIEAFLIANLILWSTFAFIILILQSTT